MRRAALLVLLAAAAAVAATDARLVPTYSARYQEDQTLREILAELKAIRSELRGLRQAQDPAAPRSLAALFTARCAGCHGARVAGMRGEGFVVLEADGKVPDFTAAERRRISRLVSRDDMPKGGPPLSEADKRFLQDQLFPESKP